MWVKRKWLVLWSLWAVRLVPQYTEVIRVSGGLLRGVVAPDGSHAQYTGIYYGTVSYENRFQAPGPELKWEGIFDANQEHIRCNQLFNKVVVMGRSQCLVLNVYTPLKVNLDERLAVMFYIHGGAFLEGWGSAAIYGPKYLTAKKVILVTINYRLSIHGFLCLGIKEAPGNAGMKDQVAALKWVQKNIKHFGGDPDNVTIMGQSAGGSSVSYHLLSPMSKGLFHKAIIESGSSTAPWALQYKPLYLASLLAKTMGYESIVPHQLYKYFMTKTDDELLVVKAPRRNGSSVLAEVVFTPCVEKIIKGVEPYLTELPYDMLSKGDYHKVPLILGSTNQEGLMIIELDNDTMISLVDFEKSMPKNLIIPLEKKKEVAKTLQRLYLGDNNVSIETSPKLLRWYGEPHLNYPTLEDTELMLRTTDRPIFNYMFKYVGWRNVPRMIVNNRYKIMKGASHADEVFYLFSQELIPSLFENKMIERMTRMWTNFAKYGDPTPEVTELLPVKWHPTNSSSPRALVIDEEFSTEPLWYNEAVKYLRHLYSKYRRKL